jgi:tetratricopeptide (TPR) repeat protein
MLRAFLYASCLILIYSCNSHASGKIIEGPQIRDTANSQEQKWLLIAKGFYSKHEYSLAKPYFDSLISINPVNGEYYFKRAYCKTDLSSDDSSAIGDYFKAIEFNYRNKQSAYLNIGAAHRFKAIFRCRKEAEQIQQLDSTLYYYDKCLEIDPNDEKAIQEKREAENDLILIKNKLWPSHK